MIFFDEIDRQRLLDIVALTMHRLDAEVLAFCLMGNHYHFVVRTRQANLSRLMRHVNGEYTRTFNRRHDFIGHLFQGRFKAILVDSDPYLMELCRYVELNPVRAGLARTAADWPWSSYRAHVGLARPPDWLATSCLHDHVLGRDARTIEDRERAANLYAQLVADGLGVDLWGTSLRQEIFLGDENFIAELQSLADSKRIRCIEIPKVQRARPASLSNWLSADCTSDEAIWLAYSEGGMTMSAIAKETGVSVASVSRMIAREQRAAKCKT